MELNLFLENKNANSAFSATQSDIGGTITFSNSGKRGTVKQFTLGLDSFISILKDIKQNLSAFAPHQNYVEQDWRDLGSQYYTDGPANAMSTVQTKPLFSTISKIIVWANSPTLDNINTDQNCPISAVYLDNAIKGLEDLSDDYKPKSKDGPLKKSVDLRETIIIESKTIREFALSVFKYFYDGDWNKVIDNTTNKAATIDATDYVSLDYGRFKRLLGEFEESKDKDDLTTANTQRYFDVPVVIKDGKYYYFSTQWNTTGDDGLSLNTLKEYFEGTFHGYKIIERDGRFLLSKDQIPAIPYSNLSFYEAAKEAGLKFSKPLTERFTSAILAKPFVILTGLSGSGKTKLAQAFALWICESKEQYCIVPIGADWTNREPLLGFPNALKSDEYIKPDNGVLNLIISANTNPEKPHFLILDEMNLSHVERYFADFLSVMETSGKIALHSGPADRSGVQSDVQLPPNLFIIGTVNIDETTYMFSPKVLDRANVIEFKVTIDEMEAFLSATGGLDMSSLESLGAGMAESFVAIAADKALEPKEKEILQPALLAFFKELKQAGAEFGYRSASEIIRFAAVVNKTEPAWTTPKIIDAAILQKLLPKVHGSRRKLEPVLKMLGSLCLHDGQRIEDFITSKTEIDFSEETKIKYPLSLEKILRMYRSLLDNGFTSFAEA